MSADETGVRVNDDSGGLAFDLVSSSKPDSTLAGIAPNEPKPESVVTGRRNGSPLPSWCKCKWWSCWLGEPTVVTQLLIDELTDETARPATDWWSMGEGADAELGDMSAELGIAVWSSFAWLQFKFTLNELFWLQFRPAYCLPCTFMCLRSELGCVYDLSHPLILQQYGLAELWTCECFFRSELFAKRRSQPSFSHLNGFSPIYTARKTEKKINKRKVRIIK